MPKLTSGNTMAATYMIAEHGAAGLVREHEELCTEFTTGRLMPMPRDIEHDPMMAIPNNDTQLLRLIAAVNG